MTSHAYLIALLVSIAGMTVVDHRWRLALFRDAGAAAIVLTAGVAFFLGWDLVGVQYGLFFRGDSPYMTGYDLAPDLPVEEAFFLYLLSYTTLVFYAAARRALDRRGHAARREALR